jgi:uncharacterized membrane protein YdjX (TVP38/TMEM64 family)
VLIAIIISHYWGKITPEDIFNYVPDNYLLAAITIIGLFLIKSLSVVLPLMALYISSGMIFSPLWGIIVNLIGLFISLTIPYLLGRFCGKGLLDRLLVKYKNIEKLKTIKSKNEWFLSYILRMIGILPGDIVSMSLGAMNINYNKYIVGSIVGLLPRMVVATCLGSTITDPTSPVFILSCVITVVLTGGSMFLHQRFMKKEDGRNNAKVITRL